MFVVIRECVQSMKQSAIQGLFINSDKADNCFYFLFF